MIDHTLTIDSRIDETLNQPRRESHYWLTKIHRDVNIVLLISTSDTLQMLFSWSDGKTDQTLGELRRKLQYSLFYPNTILLDYHVSKRSHNYDPLILPIHLVFDVIPAGLPRTGLTITAAGLQSYATECLEFCNRLNYIL